MRRQFQMPSPSHTREPGKEPPMSSHKSVGPLRQAGQARRALIPMEQPNTLWIVRQRSQGRLGPGVNRTVRFQKMNCGFQGGARQFGELSGKALILKGKIVNALKGGRTP